MLKVLNYQAGVSGTDVEGLISHYVSIFWALTHLEKSRFRAADPRVRHSSAQIANKSTPSESLIACFRKSILNIPTEKKLSPDELFQPGSVESTDVTSKGWGKTAREHLLKAD